jgi:hypothetical protein
MPRHRVTKVFGQLLPALVSKVAQTRDKPADAERIYGEHDPEVTIPSSCVECARGVGAAGAAVAQEGDLPRTAVPSPR